LVCAALPQRFFICGKPRTRPQTHNTKQHRFSNNHHKHKHHHGSLPTTPVKKSGKAAAARRCSLEHRPAAGFACPSFAAAPKPEALPLPTSLLLSRRSPSPPKMQHAAAAAARA
jgi:hypothetical protein